MADNEIPNESTTLRKAVLASISDNPLVKEQLLELLSTFDSKNRENDIVYALLLEMELLHRVLAQQQIQNQEQHKVLTEAIRASVADGQKNLLETIAIQQTLFRSQFRRLVAIHRERFLIRAMVFASVVVVGIFAGIGAFCFYKLTVG